MRQGTGTSSLSRENLQVETTQSSSRLLESVPTSSVALPGLQSLEDHHTFQLWLVLPYHGGRLSYPLCLSGGGTTGSNISVNKYWFMDLVTLLQVVISAYSNICETSSFGSEDISSGSISLTWV